MHHAVAYGYYLAAGLEAPDPVGVATTAVEAGALMLLIAPVVRRLPASTRRTQPAG
jgi:hypothetical protein